MRGESTDGTGVALLTSMVERGVAFLVGDVDVEMGDSAEDDFHGGMGRRLEGEMEGRLERRVERVESDGEVWMIGKNGCDMCAPHGVVEEKGEVAERSPVVGRRDV